MTISWSGHRGLRVTWGTQKRSHGSTGRIGNGDIEVVGHSIKGLSDSDKWRKALLHLFLKNCCLPREESCSEFLGCSPC